MKLQDIFENDDIDPHVFNEIKENTVYDKSVPIYRALSGKKYANIGKAEIRKYRKPLDSPVYSTIIFNELFRRIHGIDNIRQVALFAGNTFDIAQQYLKMMDSSVNYIFPNTGSKFIFNEEFTDSFNNLDLDKEYDIREVLWHLHISFPISIDQLLKNVKNSTDPEIYDMIREGIVNALSNEHNNEIIDGYKIISNISDIPSTPAEIMIIGDYYYYFNNKELKEKYTSYKQFVEKEL